MTSVFKLPTTGIVDYASALRAHGPLGGGRDGGELAQASRLRGRVRAVLKEYKRREDDDDDHGLSVIKAIEDYLPYLVAIANAIGSDHLNGRLVFSWRSVLSGHRIDLVNPRVDVVGIQAELVFTLLTLAFAYSNTASHHAARVPERKAEDGIDLSTQQQMRNASKAASNSKKASNPGVQVRDVGGVEADKHLKYAAEQYCNAAAILDFVAGEILSSTGKYSCDEKISSQGIPEMNSKVAAGCAEICTARAEAVAIRKLQLRASQDGNPVRPGLIAKIYLNVASHYREAIALFESTKKSSTGGKSGATINQSDLSSELLKHVEQGASFYSSLARKFLAIDSAGGSGSLTLNGKHERNLDKSQVVQMGHAIAFLESAKHYMMACQPSTPVGLVKNLGRGMEQKDEFTRMACEELASIDSLSAYYVKLNSSIHFQPKTPLSTINALIPSGRAVMTVKSYGPPSPAFTPPSLSDLPTKSVPRFSGDNASDDNDISGVRNEPYPVKGNAYAIQDAYY